jgi:hypothetical protein
MLSLQNIGRFAMGKLDTNDSQTTDKHERL